MTTELVKFDGLKAEISVFVAPTSQIVVTDAQTNAVALDTLKQVKALQKRIEEKRQELVGPHNDFVKQVNSYAKEIGAPLAQAEDSIKAKMRDFSIAEDKRRQEEFRKLEQERLEAQRKAEQERLKLEAEARERAKAMAAFGGSQETVEKQKAEEAARISREQVEQKMALQAQARAIEAQRPKNTRKEWRFEITDGSQIPREYLVYDERIIRAAIAKGVRTIPGVRIFEETIVVAR